MLSELVSTVPLCAVHAVEELVGDKAFETVLRLDRPSNHVELRIGANSWFERVPQNVADASDDTSGALNPLTGVLRDDHPNKPSNHQHKACAAEKTFDDHQDDLYAAHTFRM